MPLAIAEAFLTLLGIYAAIGLVFAIAFVTFGAGKVDPAARTMPVRVRLLIIPGALLLWPVMAFRWATKTAPPVS